MNNKERIEWVNQDEVLYKMWMAENMNLMQFLRYRRDVIDARINELLNLPR